MSVQWGAWHGVGMVAASEAVLSRMRRTGIGTLSPLAGLAALGAVLHSAGSAQVIFTRCQRDVSANVGMCRVHNRRFLRHVARCQVAAVPFAWTAFLQNSVHRQPFYADFLQHVASRQSVNPVERPGGTKQPHGALDKQISVQAPWAAATGLGPHQHMEWRPCGS